MKIEELYFFIGTPNGKGDECMLVGTTSDGDPMALVSSTYDGALSLLPRVQKLADSENQEVELIKLSNRESMKLIKPNGPDH